MVRNNSPTTRFELGHLRKAILARLDLACSMVELLIGNLGLLLLSTIAPCISRTQLHNRIANLSGSIFCQRVYELSKSRACTGCLATERSIECCQCSITSSSAPPSQRPRRPTAQSMRRPWRNKRTLHRTPEAKLKYRSSLSDLALASAPTMDSSSEPPYLALVF